VIVQGASNALLNPGPFRPLLAVALALGAAAFLVALLLGRPILNGVLIRYRLGKRIREGEIESNFAKMGTPTMGGLLFLIPTFLVFGVALLSSPRGLFGATDATNGVGAALLLLGVLLAFGVLGGVDDLLNLTRSASTREGLSARVKFAWQVLFGVVAAALLYFALGYTAVVVPFAGAFDLPAWVYVPAAAFALVGAANAVNFTDGLDTLAGGTSAIAFGAYAVIGYAQGQPQVAAFCLVFAGALGGFLWFNAHPAQVFMGDCGSLAIGACLAAAALQTGQWLLLPLVGAVFVVEAVSVILQVGYFKATKGPTGEGRRIFRKAPIHYHFQMLGWKETQVTHRFHLLGAAAALVALALAFA